MSTVVRLSIGTQLRSLHYTFWSTASVSEKEENHGSGPPKCGNHQVIPFIWCWVSLQKPSSKTLRFQAARQINGTLLVHPELQVLRRLATTLGMTNLPKAMATPYATLRLFAGAPRVFLKHLCYERLDGQKIQQCANLNVDYFETLRMLEVWTCKRARAGR